MSLVVSIGLALPLALAFSIGPSFAKEQGEHGSGKSKKKSKKNPDSSRLVLGKVTLVDSPMETGKLFFDLEVENLCGDGDSYLNRADAWVKNAGSSVISKTKRGVTLVVEMTRGAETTTFPIFVRSNSDVSGNAGDISKCFHVLARNIPVAQAIDITIKSSVLEETTFGGDLGSIFSSIATLATTIGAITGQPAIAAVGSGFGTAKDVLEKAAQPTHHLLALLSEKQPPVSRAFQLTEKVGQVALGRSGLKLVKKFKSSQVEANGDLDKLPAAFEVFCKDTLNTIDRIITDSASRKAARDEMPVTIVKFRDYCDQIRKAIRDQAGGAIRRDPTAEALVVYCRMRQDKDYFDRAEMTCLRHDEPRLVIAAGFAERPSKWAYDFDHVPPNQQPATTPEPRQIKVREFSEVRDLLDNLATAFARAPGYLMTANQIEIGKSREEFAAVFSQEVLVDGASLDLLPERRVQRSELVDFLLNKWGAVSRMACFVSPIHQASVDEGFTAEALFLIPGKNILGVMRVALDPASHRINQLHVFRADRDYVRSISAPDGKCGAGNSWEPEKEVFL